mgnify:CR=1 FL=1
MLFLPNVTLTGNGLVPVDGKQLGSMLEVCHTVLGTLLPRQPVQLFGLCHDMVHVRHAAPPLHNHEVEPGTEEVELAFDELTLFLGGAHEIPQVLECLICLADAVPAVGPKVTLVAAVDVPAAPPLRG